MLRITPKLSVKRNMDLEKSIVLLKKIYFRFLFWFTNFAVAPELKIYFIRNHVSFIYQCDFRNYFLFIFQMKYFSEIDPRTVMN